MNDSSSLIERAKAITLKPNDTWPVIAAEPATPGDLITRYAVPLSAIGPVASFIGGQLVGISVIVATYHPSLMSGLSMALTSFVMGIVGLIVLALIADFLAPKFDGEANRTQAFKLVTYSMTPGWVAGILGIIPSLAVLGIIASLYGLYLFYLGARPVMKVPEAKAGGYTAVTVLCAIVLAFAMSAVTSSITGLFGGAMAGMMADDSGDKVELNLPGGGTLDSSKIEDAAKSLENAKDVKPADLSALQALLPTTLGAYSRTAVESTAAGGMGAQAQGTYTSGDKTIHLKVIDMAALGAVAGIVSGMGVEQNREDADGYERTGTVDGHLQVEKWSKSASSGSFAVQVASRFMIEAEGEAGSIDELKAAVAAVDQGKLAALAN